MTGIAHPSDPRLASAYLEDLAFIALSARPDPEIFDLYPDIEDTMRTRLRSRIKQLSRYDWPSSLREDPSLKRGCTLRQCYRLVVALLLVDAQLPPALAVMLAQNNEFTFLRAIAARLRDTSALIPDGNDLIAVIVLGEIREALAFPDWLNVEGGRVRLVKRDSLSAAWAGDLAGPGARLIVDVATAGSAVWRWLNGRRLMSDIARVDLLGELDRRRPEDGYALVAERRVRR